MYKIFTIFEKNLERFYFNDLAPTYLLTTLKVTTDYIPLLLTSLKNSAMVGNYAIVGNYLYTEKLSYTD